jgi:amphi-Trp domain-containing protein
MPAPRPSRRASQAPAKKRSAADRDLVRTYSRAQFVAKLRRFADAIEANAPFTIQVASERLRIPAGVAFNIEHERTGSREELEFQMSWSRDDVRPAKTRERA